MDSLTDVTLRDGLEAFFRRALRRDPAERFGNAEEMLRAWCDAFTAMDRATITADSIEVIAPCLSRTSSIAEVGYGIEARAVLDQMGIHTVHQLLGVPRLQFRYLTGVGDRIRKEIRERAKRLAELRRDLVPGGITEDDGGRATLDRLAEQLLPRRPAGDDRPEGRVLAYYLGIDEDAAPWPTPGQVAAAVGTSRSAVAAALKAARDRWHKSADLNAVRAEIDTLVAGSGGVATVDELAVLLLGSRGSVKEDDAERMRRARATIRAAVELEAAVTPTRFAAHAEAKPEAAVIVAASPENAEYGRRLGRAADKLASDNPLPTPGRVEDELGLVPVPDGAGDLTVEQDALRARVRGRFPEAAELPPRPQLDTLLDEAGAEVDWREASPDGPGYFSRSIPDSGSGTAALIRHATLAPAQEATPDVLAARAIEDKIAFAADKGVFLALTVEPRWARDAEAELLRRFPREVVSLERLMLRAMRARAEERRIAWPKALTADAAARDSADFRNLLRLAAEAAPRVAKEVLALRQPTLLTRPGLIARYDLMTMLDEFSQASGASGGPPSLWLLIPQAAPGRPEIDGAVLPVISSANWTRLTRPWGENAHRAGARPAA